jgi:AcrR family transcriptional regulator
MVSDTSTNAPQGHRERKRLRTKRALEDAALELFRERGYDATTLEDITEAAGLAPRTFFRYFASKDDVVLSGHQERMEEFRLALDARPTGENLLEAACKAAAELADGLESEPLLRLRWRLALEVPSIRGRVLSQQAEAAERLCATIAQRVGLQANSIQVRVCAISLMMALRTAIIYWTDLPDGTLSLRDATREAFAAFAGAFDQLG